MSMWQISRRWLLAAFAALAGLVSRPGMSEAQPKGSRPADEAKPGGRIEPLFTSEADARAVMQQYCVEDADPPLTAGQMDLLVSRLRPQLWLAHHQEGDRPGGTRLGGAPDLPRGMAWPLRPVPADLAQKTEGWKANHGWIVKQMQHELPFEFIAQIDAADLTRDQQNQFGLPTEGRLLVFWDGAAGLLESGAHLCRVIFDQTPLADLVRAPIPEQFAMMEAWWREPDPRQIEHFRTMARTLEAAGQKAAAKAMLEAARKSGTPDPASTKPFLYPGRARRLVPILVLPGQTTIELTQDAELSALAGADATGDHYQLLTANDIGPFTTDPAGMRRTQPWLTMEARRTRLMGLPQPEQDDPRFDALEPAQRPPYPWNKAQIAKVARAASDWLLLLQVSMADLSQQQTEGTVYFMIRKDDLARRDFARVVASYQQT